MDKREVDEWLRRYVSAWKSYDEGDVKALFTEDALYRWYPWDEPKVGREAIYEAWVAPDERDEPGTYEGDYRTIAVDGDTAVATGSSTYLEAPDGAVRAVYDNCFVMIFEDGRCKSFTEFFMERPKD